MLSIFASLAEYDCENILEKTRAGQPLAAAQGKHIGRPKGLGKGLSVAESVELDQHQPFQRQALRKHLQAG